MVDRLNLLTHRGRDKMAAILQAIFSKAFSWMKMYEFRLRFHWSLFLRVQLTIFQHWFRRWLGADQATSHYLNQWCLIYWHIYASLCLNELTRLTRRFNLKLFASLKHMTIVFGSSSLIFLVRIDFIKCAFIQWKVRVCISHSRQLTPFAFNRNPWVIFDIGNGTVLRWWLCNKCRYNVIGNL